MVQIFLATVVCTCNFALLRDCGALQNLPLPDDRPAQVLTNRFTGGMSFVARLCCDRGQPHEVWGQFFPSTPFIPGAVVHVVDGEYNLPNAGILLILSQELAAVDVPVQAN